MKPVFRLGAILTALLIVFAGAAAPAQAATRSQIGAWNEAPYLQFNRVANPTMHMFFSINGIRYRSTVTAGSGDGSHNDCLKDHGWLPGGMYYDIPHYRKTWGVTVVRGYVWELGSKACNNGSVTRTELFIHSNGIEGTPWNGSYRTEGCIKISQVDRGDLGAWWRASYDKAAGDLFVTW